MCNVRQIPKKDNNSKTKPVLIFWSAQTRSSINIIILLLCFLKISRIYNFSTIKSSITWLLTCVWCILLLRVLTLTASKDCILIFFNWWFFRDEKFVFCNTTLSSHWGELVNSNVDIEFFQTFNVYVALIFFRGTQV